MPSVALLASKGGTGKSTLCTHLAVEAHRAGRRSLAVDLDPQETTADWFAARNAEEPRLIVDVQAGELAGLLEHLAPDEWAFIDTPGHVTESVRQAARVASLILVPCRPTPHDLNALRHVADLLASIGRRGTVVFNQVQPPRGMSLSTLLVQSREALAAYDDALDVPPVDVAIGGRMAFQYSAVGQAACEIEPHGKAASDIRRVWEWLSREAISSAKSS